MKLFHCLFQTFIILQVSFVYKSAKQEEESQYPLLVLNEKNLNQFVNSNPHAFIFIHSTWCKWSQKFHTSLQKINEYLRYETNKPLLGVLDATLIDIKILKEILPQNIEPEFLTYPKLIWLENGITREFYNGIMNLDSTYLWIKRVVQPYSLPVNLMQVLQTKVKFDKKSFVFLGEPTVGNPSFKIFEQIARESNSGTFYHTDEKVIVNYLNPDRNFTVAMLQYGKLNSTMKENITSSSLKEFIENHTIINYYDRVKEDTINDVFIRKNPAVVFFLSKFDEEYIYFYRVFKLMAKSLRSKYPSLKFVMTDIDSKYSMKLANFFSFRNPGNLPTVRIVDYQDNQFRRFQLSRNITKNNIEGFIKKWSEGDLKPYKTFESFESDIAKLSKNSLVKKVDYNSYFEAVNSNRKNVVVLFFTEWCSHCKKLFFMYETLSKKFNKELITFNIVNLQNRENNIHGIKVVPSLYLYRSHNKEEPVVFDRKYTIKEMTEFISTTFSLPVLKTDL